MSVEEQNVKEIPIRDIKFSILNIPKIIFLGLIRIYQKIISPALPANTCRFYPSCSDYAYQAISKYGAVKGSAMGIYRILRCNPFNEGGYDPVP